MCSDRTANSKKSPKQLQTSKATGATEPRKRALPSKEKLIGRASEGLHSFARN